MDKAVDWSRILRLLPALLRVLAILNGVIWELYRVISRKAEDIELPLMVPYLAMFSIKILSKGSDHLGEGDS